ncbi:tetratricopeptide repeat protein [Pseudomonas sp. Leaf127]|uniref:tetratricopeptide repeat protein n=1 Tax=Pseudomonas sp. Leaf127 TaxID=1736267 RepID=UPI001F42D244|nr:DUF6396 domain-containing protein [Pseudomonas sp. Leaf127]
MNPPIEAKSKLDFTCTHEIKPEPSAEIDLLFKYARWLQKNNQLKEDRTVNVEIERLYRIAAEHDHHKANINLQNGTMRGHFKLNEKEHLRMSQNLMNASVATGYYFIGIFLRNGSAGLREDTEMSLRFFRKAADTGNAQAQYLVGDQLLPIGMAPEIGRKMYRCAAEQGHGEAASGLGIHLTIKKQYREALEAFQLGVKAGDNLSASILYKSFRNQLPDEPHYLHLQEDQERADRYEKIWRILANYSYANPKVPEINEFINSPRKKVWTRPRASPCPGHRLSARPISPCGLPIAARCAPKAVTGKSSGPTNA